jgi:translation elongation factor EF-G
MRKVETSKAQVAYDESVPKEQQMGAASEALKPGADVRITAEQASDGEWHATRIDIMGSQATKQMFMDNDNDDQDDEDLYQLQLNGSNRPILRKGL